MAGQDNPHWDIYSYWAGASELGLLKQNPVFNLILKMKSLSEIDTLKWNKHFNKSVKLARERTISNHVISMANIIIKHEYILCQVTFENWI